jgi:anti-sigma B factor antagonist
MQISVKSSGGLSTIHLDGDFIGEPDQKKLRDKVRELVNHGHTHLVIDLARVKHMNSCGLGALVCALTTVRRAGGDLHLAVVGSAVHDLLRITQLDGIFRIYPTVDEAIAQHHIHA